MIPIRLGNGVMLILRLGHIKRFDHLYRIGVGGSGEFVTRTVE